MNDDGHVCEGSVENLFVVRGGVVVTPSVTQDILEGITRRTVIQLLREELGATVVERPIDRTEVYLSDEVFLTGTGVQVVAVTRVDNRHDRLGPDGRDHEAAEAADGRRRPRPHREAPRVVRAGLPRGREGLDACAPGSSAVSASSTWARPTSRSWSSGCEAPRRASRTRRGRSAVTRSRGGPATPGRSRSTSATFSTSTGCTTRASTTTARGRAALRPADLQNRKTHEARYNERPLEELLEAFRSGRGRFVARLEAWEPERLSAPAVHPRLQQPMRLVDMLYFTAEHDDHHLLHMTELARRA